MDVSTSPDIGPLTPGYNHWPLERLDEVHIVSTTFKTSNPSLCSPLLSATNRATTLRTCRDLSLNCGGLDHGANTWQRPSTNKSGVQLEDGGYAFQQLRKRMFSHRRGQYERSVERNSNSHSKRFNSRGRDSSNNDSNNNGRHHSNSSHERSSANNSNIAAGSQWSNHRHNN